MSWCLSAVEISVTASVVDNLPVQVGQTLVATATITGDTNDTASLITYQWQILEQWRWDLDRCGRRAPWEL